MRDCRLFLCGGTVTKRLDPVGPAPYIDRLLPRVLAQIHARQRKAASGDDNVARMCELPIGKVVRLRSVLAAPLRFVAASAKREFLVLGRCSQ